MKNANLVFFFLLHGVLTCFLQLFSEFLFFLFAPEQIGILALQKQVLQEILITYSVFQPRAHFTAYF